MTDNISITYEGKDLVIRIKLGGPDYGPSSTGKTTILASTCGGRKLDDGKTSLNLTLYKKREV